MELLSVTQSKKHKRRDTMKTIMKSIGIVILSLVLTNVYSQTKELDLTPDSGIEIDHLRLKGALSVVLQNGAESRVWIEYDVKEDTPEANVNIDYDAAKKQLTINHNMVKGYPGKLFIQSDEFQSIRSYTAIDLDNRDTLRGESLRIIAEGASEIDLVVDVKELHTDLSGASSVEYTGVARSHYIKSSGAADIHAKRLFTRDLTVDASGLSNIDVLVSNSLSGNLSGTSNLTNHTKAKINNIETSGTSSIGSNSDTTQFRFGRSKITITDADFSLGEDDEDVEEKEEEFDGHWGGFELGFNGYMNVDNKMALPEKYSFLELKEEKSILVNINLLEQNFNLIRNHVGLVTGLGLQYNNYRFANNIVLENDSNEIFGFEDKNPDRNYVKSKLVVNYLQVPLILEFTTHGKHEFHIGAGAQFGWKIGEHSKIVYEEGTDKEKVKDRGDFYLRPYKLELTGRIGWGFVNLFATYSLTEMFEDNKGPEMYPFTAGITLIGW